MHSKGKGMSASAIPYRRTPPQWLKREAEELCDQICKLSKKGLTPSQIGVILRDRDGVAQVKSVTGNKILRILKSNGVPTLSTAPNAPARRLTRAPSAGMAPVLPEDLYHLIKKAVSVRKHLERNRKDQDAKFRLILIESRIHRLARYYRLAKKLPPNWRYQSGTASTLVA
jgi:small subunit ribosomal protein S13e